MADEDSNLSIMGHRGERPRHSEHCGRWPGKETVLVRAVSVFLVPGKH